MGNGIGNEGNEEAKFTERINAPLIKKKEKKKKKKKKEYIILYIKFSLSQVGLSL